MDSGFVLFLGTLFVGWAFGFAAGFGVGCMRKQVGDG